LNYEETLAYLLSRLPVFQKVGAAAYTGSLDNTLVLDSSLGHPHKNFSSIHIAGTNGKGSVAHMLAAILQKAGSRTGLYTSPHLKDFRERIRVNGQCIEKEAVVEFTARCKELMERIQPSFFEITVAMAFEYFSAMKVDMAVVETGMGGRLDSTNILTPRVSVITNIGLDHTRFLGETIREIAAEKAGIIKNDVPVVIGQTQPGIEDVFTRAAGERNAPLVFADQVFTAEHVRTIPEGQLVMDIFKQKKLQFSDLSCDLPGLYQQKNIPAVLAALVELDKQGINIPDKVIRSGISEVRKITGLRGRWEIIGHDPLIVCDTAHNEDGLAVVTDQVKKTPHEKLHVIFGMVNDKDPDGVLKHLPADAEYYFTQAGIPRAMDRYTLADIAANAGLKGKVHDTPVAALQAARNNAAGQDMILVTGSTFVVAEVL
jgi:dihydrofolate synthase/folylpolyglutamate synthase